MGCKPCSVLNNDCLYPLKIENNVWHSLGCHNQSYGSQGSGTLPLEIAACVGVKWNAIWHALLQCDIQNTNKPCWLVSQPNAWHRKAKIFPHLHSPVGACLCLEEGRKKIQEGEVNAARVEPDVGRQRDSFVHGCNENDWYETERWQILLYLRAAVFISHFPHRYQWFITGIKMW